MITGTTGAVFCQFNQTLSDLLNSIENSFDIYGQNTII